MRDVVALPKANLHVHLENAVRLSTLRDIAARNGAALPGRLFGERCAVDNFSDFFVQSRAARACLVEAEDFRRVAYEFCEDESVYGVRYAEVTFTAAAHGERVRDWDKPLLAVIEGFAAGEADFGIRCRLVLDHSRKRPVERAWRTLELALDHLDVVVALGLGGDDTYPAEPFREVFAAAKAAGLRSVPHAGEAAGPESVRDALTLLHADRIGHGIRALDDPELVRELQDARVPLEVCPASNVALGLVPSLEAHPLPRLMDAGVTVTLNTDIPTMTGVSIAAEYENARTVFGFDDDRLASLAAAGVNASFAPLSLQNTLREGIRTWLRAT
jgi:adenosine deaminase